MRRPREALRSMIVTAAACAAAACVQELSDHRPDGDVRSPDAAADAAGPAGCRDVQLLGNGGFDDAPLSVGWTARSNVADDYIVTGTEGFDAPAAHSAPNKAYFGGLDGVDESLYQSVVVPAGTTRLVLTGQYQVRTSERVRGVFDEAWLELTVVGGASEELERWSNSDATTSWTSFSRTIGQPHAGEILRVELRAVTDAQRWSSFLFDSLALTATVCS